MAEAVTISHGETITQILKTRRSLQDYEVHAWLPELRSLNPHISNLDRINPGQYILIPDTPFEDVPFETIWQNAFSRIPRTLESPHEGNTHLFLTATGTDIDSIAKRMFADGPYGNLPLSTKRAILLHNNPDLMHYLDTNRLPGNMLVDITPLRLDKFDKDFWQGERNQYMSYLRDFDPNTRDLFQQTGPQDAYLLARLIQALKDAGASVGPDEVVRGVGYGTAGVAGYASSAKMSLTNINALARQMYEDAAKQMGRKAAASVKQHNLKKLAQIIKAHPNYPQLMRHLQKLPQSLLPMPRHKMLPLSPSNVNSTTFARHFSKQYFQAFRRWPSGKYMKTIARQLNGKLQHFKLIGRYATYYVPAIIGAYNVYNAPRDVKVRTVFEEGFGILGGAIGTSFGTAVGVAGVVTLLFLSSLCLGPVGMLIIVGVCASIGGLAGYEISKKMGGGFYDHIIEPNFGQIVYSPIQYIEEF